MEESRFVVPTYYGRQNELLPNSDYKRLEFSDPLVRILAREADGLRLVLGSHEYDDRSAPDIQVERRPHGWVIFLHPVGGSDASGYVYFLDDGRSYIVPENGLGPTPAIVQLKHDDVDEIDRPEEPPGPCEPSQLCELCGIQLTCSGDNWGELCPECADLVSAYLDRRGLTDEDRDAAVAYLNAGPK